MLFFLTFAIMIGLPRLADKFRDGDPRVPSLSNARADIQAEPRDPTGRDIKGMDMSPLVSVALQPSEGSAAAADSQRVPATEKELILAIKKELARLGYYDGPATARWTKGVRLAVRHFVSRSGGSEKNGRPTLKLLAALQAYQPAGVFRVARPGGAFREKSAPAKHGQRHRRHRQGRVHESYRRTQRSFSIPGF
jgi:hypothetical protein